MQNSVRTLRTQAGLSQADLATAMGVSRQTINSIENGRYLPSLPLAHQPGATLRCDRRGGLRCRRVNPPAPSPTGRSR